MATKKKRCRHPKGKREEAGDYYLLVSEEPMGDGTFETYRPVSQYWCGDCGGLGHHNGKRWVWRYPERRDG
jgi:hypothetical protein